MSDVTRSELVMTLPAGSPGAKSRSLVSRLREDRAFMATTLLLLTAVCVVTLAPDVLNLDPNAAEPTERFKAPFSDLRHPLGTDHLGRDLLARTLWGGRSSLLVGFVPVLVGSGLGIGVGLTAGYRRGVADLLLMRAVDAFLSIPGILLAISAVVALGAGIPNMIIVLSVFFFPGAARLARGATLVTCQKAYVEAARSVGATPLRLVLWHVLPNILAPMIVYGTLGVANMILLSAGLSFLGMGAQPPAVDWGGMIAEGQSYVRLAPHVVYVPGLAIFLVALLVNVLGDALQDTLDPKSVNSDRV